ncbi:DNA replication protein [Xenorhabdus bovienii]|uniref:replication protein P n=1 Tax=Xenorhabdus bovienii TaxID=40576 RepID=UPI001EDE3542|nr:replication protein P [Xenorhabdus bovienii]MCG3462721.1 DNA replication protein [Xenorhabdus bovienii]
MRNIATAIQNRDGRALQAMSEPPKQQQAQITQQIAAVFNELFRQLKGAFPALMASIKTQEDFDELRRQWVLAFAENGIRTIEQVNTGMKIARRQETPFLPSPGQFIQWCHQGEAVAIGLPTEEDLYGMFRDYCARRGWGDYQWQSNACYWMVTKIYSEMIYQNLTDSEVKKLCSRELKAMAKRIQAGENIPEPKVQLVELHRPTSQERALNHLAEIRRKFNLKSHKQDH